MTRAGLEKIVRTWQKRLRLDHWDITVDWTTEPEGGNWAHIKVSDDYEDATICFSKSFPKWNRKFANDTVVHELLHCFENGTKVISQSLEAALNADAYQIVSAWYAHAAENWVDRLACILVDLAGTA